MAVSGTFKERIKSIEELALKFDPVELLLRLSLLANFVPKSNTSKNWTLREVPILQTLSSICLRLDLVNFGNALPETEDLKQIADLLEQLYYTYDLEDGASNTSKYDISNPESVAFIARLQKITRDVNPSAYEFQTHNFLSGVFDKFANYFIEQIGCSAKEAWEFSTKIVVRYQRLINEQLANLREQEQGSLLSSDEAKLDFSDPLFSTPETIKKVFLFRIDEFCTDEGIQNGTAFRAYLNAISCTFGDETAQLATPLDESIIVTHPLIRVNDFYFAPIPYNLISNLPVIFERFLERERRTQSSMWQKFKKQKTAFTDASVYEYFARIFPSERIFTNVNYRFRGELYETDMLICFDNKLFIVENKSGSLTAPAIRGALDRLKTDLKKLMGDAYKQSRRTQDYMASVEVAEFFDERERKLLEIKYNRQHIDVFLVNVTLEPLMSFAANLKRLESLNLFGESVRLWSVNLFELDIVTRHIPSPTILIHFLQQRLDAQKEGVFHSFDELGFFGRYLDVGNFYIGVTESGEIPEMIVIDGRNSLFDNHYTFGEDPPQLKIQSELLEIIQSIESEQVVGYSRLACALLDFPHHVREAILAGMKKFTMHTRDDKAEHDFTVTDNNISTGLTFMSHWESSSIKDHLATYCLLKKHQTKMKRWIGLGKDATNMQTFADVFLYIEGEWQPNAELDEKVREMEQRISSRKVEEL